MTRARVGPVTVLDLRVTSGPGSDSDFDSAGPRLYRGIAAGRGPSRARCRPIAPVRELLARAFRVRPS